MASFMGTGISEEELLRQQREAERLAREQAAAAEREAAEQTAKAQEEAQAATQAAQEQAEATAEAAQEAAQPVSSVSPDILAYAMQQVGNPIQEQKSAFEDISYEADFVKPGTMSATAGGVYKVDPMTGKAGFDFSDLHGKDEQWLFKNRSSVAGNPQMLRAYDDYIDQRRSDGLVNSQNMGFLSGIGLMDVNGADIDIGAASPQMVVQGIGGIADTAKRKEAAKAFTALTQTPGSRFYGFNVDEDALGTYRDSASMTQAAYNEAVKAYKSKFWASSGHEEQNNLLYRSEYQRIQNNPNYDEYAKRLLTQTLNEIYTGITQGEAPDMNTPQSENDKLAAENAAMEMDIAQDEKSDLKAAMEAIPDTPQEVAERLAQMEAPARMEEIPSEPKQLERAPSNGAAQEIFMQEALKGAPAVTATQGEKQTVDSSAAYDIFADRATAGLDIPGAAQMQEEAPLKIENMADAYDVYKMGKSYLLGEEDRKYLEELLNDPGVKRLNGQLDADAMKALNVGNESPEYLMTRNLSALGTTVYNAWQDIHSDDFPPELRTNAEMIIMETVRDAGKAVERGQVVSDHGKNQIETYLDTVEGARDGINTIYADWQSLTQNKLDLDADLAAVNEKAIENAKIAVREGYDSPQQYALVLENSDVKPAQVYEAMQAYPLYEEIAYIYSDYFTDGGGFDNSPIKARLNASGVTNDDQYRFALRDGMNALYEEDVKMALTLGLSIEDYYASMGGMSADQLAQRANVRMQQQGASITQEERDALSVQPFGEGVGAAATVGTAAKRGWDSFQLGFLDTLYMGKNALAARNTAAKMTGYYQGQFGIYGRDYYRSDMLKLADSGSLDERYAQAIRDALDSGEDIYSIGIDPRDMGGLLSKAGDIRKNIAQYDNMMRTRGTEGEYFWYNMLASTVENGAMMAASTLGGATLGSAAAGFAVGYGVPNFSQRYNERLDQGYKLNTASALAALDTTGMIAANVGTFTRGFGQLTGAGSLEKAGYMAARMNNASGLAKGMAAIRTFGGAAIKNTAEEAIKDPFAEGMTQRFIDTAFAPLYQKADAGEDVSASDVVTSLTAALSPMNVLRAAEETAEETVKNAPEEALYSLIFTLAGAGVETYHSVRMARDVVSGRSGDVQGVIDAAAEDLKTPEFAEYLNEKAKQNQIDEATTVAMMTGAGDEHRTAAQEQRQIERQHMEKAQAGAVASETARERFLEIGERVENGQAKPSEMDDALSQWQKAETSYRENRDAAQKAGQKAAESADRWIDACRQEALKRVAKDADTARAAVMGNEAAQDAAYDRAEGDYVSAAESGDTARMQESSAAMDAAYPGVQGEASLGATDYEASEESANMGTLNPVMQQRASDLYKKTGLALVTAPLPDGVRGYYDRESGQIVLSNRIGVNEQSRMTTVHELSHFIEGSKDYDQFAEAVLSAAYDGNSDAMERDMADIRDKYEAAGVPYDERKELVTAAVEKIIDADETFIQELMGQRKQGMIARIYTKLKKFLARRKAKSEGAAALRQYDLIQTAHDKLKQALENAPKWEAGQDGKAYAIIQDESNWPIVKADRNFVLSDNRKEWGKQINDYIRDEIREKGQMVIKTLDGEEIVLDAKSQRKAKDWLMNGTEDDNRIRKNASAHLDEVVAVSEDVDPNGPNVPDEDAKHEWAKDGWRYREAVFEDYNGKRYLLTMSVGVDGDNKTVYNIGDVEEIKKRTVTSVSGQLGRVPRSPARTNESPASPRLGPSDTIVPQDGMDVNKQDTQNGRSYAVGERQFGNKTAQRSDYFYDEVKDKLKGSTYEKDSNDAQIRRAVRRLEEDGLDASVDYLLGIEPGKFTTDDNVLLMAAAVEAGRKGDATLQWKLADRLDKEGTEQGRALQSRKILTAALRPQQEVSNTVRKAIAYNQARGLLGDPIPVGNDAPKKATAATKPDVRETYDKAESTHMKLQGLESGVSRDNPWGLPINRMQDALISQYGLKNETLPGIEYNRATLKQRMLAAILATPNNVRGDGLLTLCQQLEFMNKGYAVVTEADMNYIASQMSEAMAGGLDEAGVPTSQEAKDAMARLFDAQGNITLKGNMEKASNIAYANMLSSTATWTRNVMSNALVTPLENASRDIAAWLDEAVSKRTGTRTTGTATKEDREASKAAFAQEIANTVRDYFVTHTDTGHGRKYDVRSGGGRTFQNDFLEGYKNIVEFAMQIGDRPFFEKCYAEEKAIIERLGMKVTDENGNLRAMTADEIHAEATARATERVFQEDGDVINWLNRMPPSISFIGKTLIPFTKTPTNIAKRMFQYSPAGLVKSIVWDGMAKGNMNGGADFDQRKFVMGLGRGLTGTGMIAVGAALGAAGIIKTGRGDEEEKKRRDALGALGEPYGMYLDLFGTKHEIDWALPSATGLILGASMAERMKDGEGAWNIVAGMMMDLGDELFENSMLSAVNDLFRGYDDATGIATRLATTFAESKLNQMLSPSFMRQIAKATDPYVRDTSDDNPVLAALKTNVIQYWPGLRQMLPIKTDLTGDKQLQSGYWNPGKETGNALMHFFDSYLTPTATVSAKNDAALMELIDLSYRTDSAGFLPENLIANGKYSLNLTNTQAKSMGYGDAAITMNLTDEEKREANAAYGSLLFNGDGGRYYLDTKGNIQMITGLRRIMDSPEWAAMTDEERTERVKDEIKIAKDCIIADVARRKHEDGEI